MTDDDAFPGAPDTSSASWMMRGTRDMAGPARDDGLGDRLEVRPRLPAVRWNLILIWFMRLAALLWILKGLLSWTQILGIGHPPVPFETRSMGYQATVIYFAIIDLVAAVGLWLTSTWGGVMWLLAVMSHLILAFFFPAILPSSTLSIALFGLSVAIYLVVSWLAAGEEA